MKQLRLKPSSIAPMVGLVVITGLIAIGLFTAAKPKPPDLSAYANSNQVAQMIENAPDADSLAELSPGAGGLITGNGTNWFVKAAPGLPGFVLTSGIEGQAPDWMGIPTELTVGGYVTQQNDEYVNIFAGQQLPLSASNNNSSATVTLTPDYITFTNSNTGASVTIDANFTGGSPFNTYGLNGFPDLLNTIPPNADDANIYYSSSGYDGMANYTHPGYFVNIANSMHKLMTMNTDGVTRMPLVSTSPTQAGDMWLDPDGALNTYTGTTVYRHLTVDASNSASTPVLSDPFYGQTYLSIGTLEAACSIVFPQSTVWPGSVQDALFNYYGTMYFGDRPMLVYNSDSTIPLTSVNGSSSYGALWLNYGSDLTWSDVNGTQYTVPKSALSPDLSNSSGGQYSVVCGGAYNTIAYDTANAIIGGGYYNSVNSSSSHSVIGGGEYNTIGTQAYYNVIGGGYYNNVADYAWKSVIGGGEYNSIGVWAYYATVGGGTYNRADVYYSTVGGGDHNMASGWGSTVVGGLYNEASNTASVAMGQYAWANNFGQVAVSSGSVLSKEQHSEMMVRGTSDGDMEVVLYLDGLSMLPVMPGSDDRMWDISLRVDGMVVIKGDAVNLVVGDAGVFWRRYMLKRVSGVMTLYGPQTVVPDLTDMFFADPTIEVVAVQDGISVEITPPTDADANTQIRWLGHLSIVELAP